MSDIGGTCGRAADLTCLASAGHTQYCDALRLRKPCHSQLYCIAAALNEDKGAEQHASLSCATPCWGGYVCDYAFSGIHDARASLHCRECVNVQEAYPGRQPRQAMQTRLHALGFISTHQD